MALAGWASIESEKQTESGYEKTVKQDGRIVHEEWDGSRKSGEYSVGTVSASSPRCAVTRRTSAN